MSTGSSPASGFERINLAQLDDPRDAVHLAVAALARQSHVALPAADGYAILASALAPELPCHDSRPLLLLQSPAEIDDWIERPPAAARNLARRVWPGPLILRLPLGAAPGDRLIDRLPSVVADALAPDGALDLTAPADPLLRSILELSAAPVLQLATRVEPIDPAQLQPALALWIEAASSARPGSSSAAARPARIEFESDSWKTVHLGPYEPSQLDRLAAFHLLFVCTGNTCRSPMAEALCRVALCHRLGCDPDELASRGFVVESAGLSASKGMPAADNAIQIVKQSGGSLHTHASQPLAPQLVDAADLILTMTHDHLDHLLALHPHAAPYARLLSDDGLDIDDPIGSSLDTYAETAQQITRAIESLLDQLLPPD